MAKAVSDRHRSLQVSIPKKEYEVARGGDITLTCSFIPARPVTTALVLTWEGYPDTAGAPMISVATYFINNPIDISPAYEGRAFVEVDVDRQVSTLRLTKVTMQDSRSYQCSVMILNDDEGTPAATTALLVLVAPSKPICSLEGEAEYWHDIRLTCKSEEGSPQPRYEWKSYSVENVPRPFPPKTTENDGVLSLFNVSRETSGFFICTSSNRIGSNSYNFTLAVTPTSMNVGSTAAIVGGVLAGVVFLGIVIFCCCKKKKGKKDKYAEGAPGDVEFYDKDGSEAGEQFWDDKSADDPKQVRQHEDEDEDEDEDAAPQSGSTSRAARRPEDGQDGHHSGGEGDEDGRASEAGSRRYQDDQHDARRGSRDNLGDERGRSGGSRDRLDDERKHAAASRDRVHQRDHYRGSRDRLDDQHDSYRGSRDRLDDQRDAYRGSRDRLDDQRDTYRGSRDRLDDQRDAYRGSRDRLDDQRDTYRGSRDRLDDQRDTYRGSRDRLDHSDDQNRNRHQ
ncbi:Cell surface A33 antigen [Liparis tanakae]|uniref:Cell surface A33 antigen n=1 Tax=Liparis tanakae TaxID=230148 RepID=A0A4Z2H7S6_9TELE|nr:Cell surface A33 antigen [Liparis tanakae]